MIKNKMIFNCYGDSIGSSCKELISFLNQNSIKSYFNHIYLLPSVFHYDIDRGFSVVDYDLNEQLISIEDLKILKEMGISPILDFVLNHLSSNSPQFQDIIHNGKHSDYYNFFVDWNSFWKDNGTLNEDGVVVPNQEHLNCLYKRKTCLPCVSFKDDLGESHTFWNSFYHSQEDKTHWLGQMDLNIQEPLVWEFYQQTLKKLSDYGASVIRLDAFPCLSKIPGRTNFFNEPESWEILKRVDDIAKSCPLELLPEVHSPYQSHIYEKIGQKGYLVYDYFLPGLILDALISEDGSYLEKWGKEIIDKKLNTISMLSSHDGIPINDLRGLLPESRINKLEKYLVEEGGLVKKIYGKENATYQIFTTYFSALNENENAMLLARAIQLFFPGNPQIYYLDLLCGKNNLQNIDYDKEESKREINRSNVSLEEANRLIKSIYVSSQLDLIAYVNDNLLNQQFECNIVCEKSILKIVYYNQVKQICFRADLKHKTFEFGNCSI